MASNRRRARRLAAWIAYRNRCDRMVAGQSLTRSIRHPMRTTPGFFRAEGWDIGPRNLELRHGC